MNSTSQDPVNYTVAEGDTLKRIAQRVLGDASRWYLIADANGLGMSGNSALQSGMTLVIPKVAISANNVGTFKPYDPSKTLGSTNPALPALPHPAGGGDCGGMGQIAMIVIAVAVTYITQGATSEWLGETIVADTAAAEGTTVAYSYSSAELASIGSGATSYAAGAAAGSLAGQSFGVATGMQKDINWRQVGLSALSGGVTGGLSGVNFTGGPVSGLGNTIARAAIGNALTQGVGVALHLQPSFSWASTVASAAGAGVGYGMGQALQGTGMNPYVGAGITGFAAGTATALARGGRVSVQQIATDAAGQVLGNALVDGVRNPGTGEDRLMRANQENFRASEIAQQNAGAASAGAFENRTYGLGQLGSGTFGMDDYASTPRFAGASSARGADANGDSPNYLRGGFNVLDNVNVGADPYGLAVQDDRSRTVTIGKNQGVLAALGAEGYTSAEAKAYYGQMIASGQIGRNGIVQTGQELSFMADDFSQSKLGGRAIAAESAYRAERMAVAAQAATRLSEWDDNTTVIAGLGLPSQASRSAVDQIPTGGYAYAPPAQSRCHKSRCQVLH